MSCFQTSLSTATCAATSRLAGVQGRNRHRGVDQRNAGLEFVRDTDKFGAALRAAGFSNVEADSVDPVIYFGDDDNEYDPLLWAGTLSRFRPSFLELNLS